MGEEKAFQTAVTSVRTPGKSKLDVLKEKPEAQGTKWHEQGESRGGGRQRGLGAFYTSEQGLGLLL